MRRRFYKSKLWLLIFTFILLLTPTSFTQANPVNQTVSERLAVALVVDTSGSMRTTDPQKLRETAAQIFIDLLSPGDQLSIITFNALAEVVLPLQEVKSNADKAEFKRLLAPKMVTNGDTNYLMALNEATNQLDSITTGDVRKVILFLTDGKPEPDSRKSNNPKFMEPYMQSVWASVSDLALKRYPVYCVGFSNNIDSAVLERISRETQGTLKTSENPADLAVSFFDILGRLKNRTNTLNQTLELKGSDSIELDIDKYTAQFTLVLTNPSGSPLDLVVTPPRGVSADQTVSVSKANTYQILTINPTTEKMAGSWRVDLSGNGPLQLFANKEWFLKTRITEPAANSLQPLNEPLDIVASVSGESNDDLSVEAIVSKDGGKATTTISLVKKDNWYTGRYEKTDTAGTYDITVRVLTNDQVMATTSTKCVLKALPAIRANVFEKGLAQLQGENLVVSSSMEMAGHKLLQSRDLEIVNYQLLLKYANGVETIAPFADDGKTENGDILKQDGIWSAQSKLNQEGEAKASILVTGTYKGDNFLLEKSLGVLNVYAPGKITVTPDKTQYLAAPKHTVKISLELENTSHFRETLLVGTDPTLGSVYQNKIELEPLQKIKKTISLNPDQKLTYGNYTVPLFFRSDNRRLTLENAQFEVLVQLVTPMKLWYSNVRSLTEKYALLVFSFLVILLLLLVFDPLFYYRFVHFRKQIKGYLYYWPEKEPLPELPHKINFSELYKKKVTVSFNEESKEADAIIPGSHYQYDLIFGKSGVKKGWRPLAGFHALIRKPSDELLISTTQPGIFIYKGQVYTKHSIQEGDEFTSGNFVFRYSYKDEVKMDKQAQGKNILEGKM